MKKLIALLLTLVMVLGLAACAAKTGGNDTQTYAIITKAAGNPYNEREAAGFEEVMKDAGYNAIVKHPAEITAEAQITLINELVAQKVSGIAIAANDFDALETALKAAMDAGIKVVSCDSSCNPASRMTHINQAGVQEVAQCLVDATYDLLGGEGDWAILSATSIATNQNAWIDAMKEILKDEKYAKMNLVEIAYGDDEQQKSVDETKALLQNYPNLKLINAPTTVGIAAAAKVITDEGLQGKVIVTGCLGGKNTEEGNFVALRFPKLLGVTGPEQTEEVLRLVHDNLPRPHEPFGDLVPAGGVLLTPKHYAYLKIAEGCNHHCTFCIIPSLRGPLVSRPIGSVVREASNLVKSGVKELLVIAQDTAAYGQDVKYKLDFIGGRAVKTNIKVLFEELGKLGVWVRPHYMYPYASVDEIVPLMAEGKILPYLDVPFQHAHPRILKAMKRPGSEYNMERINAWRAICPDITIRSTFITGFPGETEEEFQYLLDFLKEARLNRVGCFAYSPVEGAAANDLPGALPESVRVERRERFMEVQSEISKELLREKVGKTIKVLVDEAPDEDGIATARSTADAPDIDGLVFIENNPNVKPGDFVDVKVTDSSDYDLFAEVVKEP